MDGMYKTLIVDDREINLMELERLDVWGDRSGFVIAGKAKNGIDALDLLRRGRFDLVITDICMAKLDGIGLLEKIGDEDLCDCVALLSEYGEFEYARRGIMLGAFDYLVKPAEEESIRRLLNRAGAYFDKRKREYQWRDYPKNDEAYLVSLVGKQDKAVPERFEIFARDIGALAPDALSAEGVVKKAYYSITYAFFEKYPWLPAYINVEKYTGILADAEAGARANTRTGVRGNARAEVDNALVRTCRRALEELAEFVDGFVFPNAPGRIRKICEYLLSNPEDDVSLQSVASAFNINNTYLSNLFKLKTGRGFNDYLTSVRIAKAKYYLEHTDLKMGEISYRLGYNDFDYFNRLFKKYIGLTPTSYRKQTLSGEVCP